MAGRPQSKVVVFVFVVPRPNYVGIGASQTTRASSCSRNSFDAHVMAPANTASCDDCFDANRTVSLIGWPPGMPTANSVTLARPRAVTGAAITARQIEARCVPAALLHSVQRHRAGYRRTRRAFPTGFSIRNARHLRGQTQVAFLELFLQEYGKLNFPIGPILAGWTKAASLPVAEY